MAPSTHCGLHPVWRVVFELRPFHAIHWGSAYHNRKQVSLRSLLNMTGPAKALAKLNLGFRSSLYVSAQQLRTPRLLRTFLSITQRPHLKAPSTSSQQPAL